MFVSDLIEDWLSFHPVWRHLVNHAPQLGFPASFRLGISNHREFPIYKPALPTVNKFSHKFFLRLKGFLTKLLDFARLLCEL